MERKLVVAPSSRGSFAEFVEILVEDGDAPDHGIQSNTESDDGSQYIVEVTADLVENLVEAYNEYCSDENIIVEELTISEA